jgi:hypothetical protein
MTIINGYANLNELQARLKIEDTKDDTSLEAIIMGVSREIDRWTGRVFYNRTETRYFDVPEGRELRFYTDCASVTTVKNGDGTTIPSTEYTLLPLNSSPKYAIRLKSSSVYQWLDNGQGDPEGVIEIVGSFCWSTTTPADVHEACLLQSERIFKRREAPFGVAGSPEMGMLRIQDGLDPDVRDLIGSYRQRL